MNLHFSPSFLCVYANVLIAKRSDHVWGPLQKAFHVLRLHGKLLHLGHVEKRSNFPTASLPGIPSSIKWHCSCAPSWCWNVRQYRNIMKWYEVSRLGCLSCQALWSMLGYLVGLGDRHGENILLDTDSGRLDHAGTRLEHLQNLKRNL